MIAQSRSENPGRSERSFGVDSGILIDLEGTGHGIGILLDGEVGDGENPSRGARYNSAIRYLRKHPESLITVIPKTRPVDVII